MKRINIFKNFRCPIRRLLNTHVIYMELKRSFKSLLIWSLSIGASMYLVIILYPLVKDLYANLPEEFANFYDQFGGVPHNVLDYFATEGGMMFQIFGAIFAAMLGFNSISREERERSSDMIYTLPVSRGSFFANKLLTVIVQIITFTVVVTIFNIVGFYTVTKSFNFGLFLYYTFLNMITNLMIAFLGFALGAIIKGKGSIALVIPLPFYIISMVAMLVKNEWLKRLKYITPFTFSEPVSILKDKSSFELVSFLIFLGISILAIVFSGLRFKRKEFNV